MRHGDVGEEVARTEGGARRSRPVLVGVHPILARPPGFDACPLVNHVGRLAPRHGYVCEVVARAGSTLQIREACRRLRASYREGSGPCGEPCGREAILLQTCVLPHGRSNKRR
jgi:hypothetical protein